MLAKLVRHKWHYILILIRHSFDTDAERSGGGGNWKARSYAFGRQDGRKGDKKKTTYSKATKMREEQKAMVIYRHHSRKTSKINIAYAACVRRRILPLIISVK